MRMIRFLIPLGIFVLIIAFLWKGLSLKPREVPSPLIDKPAPSFMLPTLHAPETMLGTENLKGQVWLLNVFASWCAPCLEEHPHLMSLAQSKVVPIYGMNYKDDRGVAMKWLTRHGDPYTGIVVDPEGRIGIDYGVYGVPETFVIDKSGMIRFKQIGPLTPDVLQQEVLPLIERLQQ